MIFTDLFENTNRPLPGDRGLSEQRYKFQRIKFRGTDHDIGEERYRFVIDGDVIFFNFPSDEDRPDPDSPSFEEILARVQRSGEVRHYRITPAEQLAIAKKIAAERQRYLDQRRQDMAEAMKPSDIPPSMRDRLTMRDIEAERPQGAFRFRVVTPQGDQIDFMDQAAAEQRARAIGGRVEPIDPQPQGLPGRNRFRVQDPQGSRPAATFQDRAAAERYASAKKLPVEIIPETIKKKLDERDSRSPARIERILKQLRARHPQAQDDLEALIYDFRSQQNQDRQDISRLDAENDAEEADIEALQGMVDNLRRRRGIAEIENPFQQPAPIRSKDPVTGKQIKPENTPSEVPPQYANYQSNLARYMSRYGPATAPVAATAMTPAATTAKKTAKVGAPAGKAALDTAVKTVNIVRSDRRQGVIDYGQDLLTAAEKKLAISRRKAPSATTIPAAEPTQTFQSKTLAPAWLGKPITTGGQTIKPTDPNYKKIADALLKQGITEKKRPVPTNKPLWGRAKAAARSKFDVYPSAYANAWAAKWYKSHGGGWRMGKGAKK